MCAKTYVCSTCKETYEKGWSDEEAIAEQRHDFPDFDIEECYVICDDCHKKAIRDYAAIRLKIREFFTMGKQ